MSDQLPAPSFDSNEYARPNHNWICGHSCEGKACPLGPDKWGRCRASGECIPTLKIQSGETKGRWLCTRSSGECESGPLPDGRCCHPISSCTPKPSLRQARKRITFGVVAISLATLLLAMGEPAWRDLFFNPGAISSPHTGVVFSAMAQANHLSPRCGACHTAGDRGPRHILAEALHSSPGLLNFHGLIATRAAEPAAMDASCLACHAAHQFHQPHAPPVSCAFCHSEHHGIKMAAITDSQCDFCHSDPAVMAATPRFVTLHHFGLDHPQFRFIVEKWRNPDTLKFDHALHLGSPTIPPLPGGAKLDCGFCHQPDASGTFMIPVTYDKNCRVCHSLQFDPKTPELEIPHGSTDHVLAFLHSLPRQYLDLATRKHSTDPDSEARSKLADIQARFGDADMLAKWIFLSSASHGPQVKMGEVRGAGRAIFPGCAYCHEVKIAGGTPAVTIPEQNTHWLSHARFSHWAHRDISCEKCHAASQSRQTSDLLLPSEETCMECHSPRGGINSACTECHIYHNPQVARR